MWFVEMQKQRIDVKRTWKINNNTEKVYQKRQDVKGKHRFSVYQIKNRAEFIRAKLLDSQHHLALEIAHEGANASATAKTGHDVLVHPVADRTVADLAVQV